MNLATGTDPIMAGYPTNDMDSGTDPIMWPVDGFVAVNFEEMVMNVLSSLHTTIEQFLATCSPWGAIVRKNYDRTPAAFLTGVGPV